MKQPKIPYVVERKGRLYFEIGKERAKAAGLAASEPLGPDGPEARARGLAAYEAYREAIGGKTPGSRYPHGSLGRALEMWKTTPEWKDMKARTKEDYERAWIFIEPQFAYRTVTKITVADSEAFHREMRKTLTPNAAHRTLKIWRALLHMLEKKNLLTKAPIGTVTNPQPVGRGQFWLARDVARMIRACGKLRHPAMGLIIRMAWETAMSPVDCRTFSMGMLKRDGSGWYIERNRSKTGAGAKPPISDELAADLQALAQSLKDKGIELLPSSPLFRNSQGRAYSRNYLTEQFQIIRRVTFGRKEKRQLLDIRRSANLEADLGGASAEDRALVMANALDRNKTLDATYTPATVARARKVLEARKAGRELLAQEIGRPSNRKPSAGSVGTSLNQKAEDR